MCTASWSAGRGSLSLCFNRDERKARGEARGPEVLRREGTRLLAAIDPDGGGTWLAVNEFGLCVFLLNNYGAISVSSELAAHPKSRGELPLKYAAFGARSRAVEAMERDSFDRYLPFLLAAADSDGADLFSWDGARLEAVANVDCFLTTSSFRTEEVEAYRKSRYETLRGGAGRLSAAARRELHLGLVHPDPAFNPLMAREESRTRSVSTIEVDDSEVRYSYEVVLGETRGLGKADRISLARRPA